MRTKGVAKISAEDAIALGASGPTLRGSGVDIDLRRDTPYTGYENFKFKVPLGKEGDVFDRYMCRVQELRESIGIVQQALDGMPEGPIKANAPKVVLPDREKMKTEMESLIYHFKIIPKASRFLRARSIRRSSLRVAKWDTTSSAMARLNHIACTCARPAWRICRLLPLMCEGKLIADVVAAIGSH